MTSKNLIRMREARLFGEVLILPTNALATSVPHSRASLKPVEGSFVKHQFART